jgi:hypothetical protein
MVTCPELVSYVAEAGPVVVAVTAFMGAVVVREAQLTARSLREVPGRSGLARPAAGAPIPGSRLYSLLSQSATALALVRQPRWRNSRSRYVLTV